MPESETPEPDTLTVLGSHPLTDAEIDELYPDGPMRDAVLAWREQALADGAAPAPEKSPCTECQECRDKAAQLAAAEITDAENEGLALLTETE